MLHNDQILIINKSNFICNDTVGRRGGGRYQNNVFYTGIPVDGDRFRIVFDGALFASHSWIRSTAVTSSTRHPSTRWSWPWPLSSSPNWPAANRSATSFWSGFNSFHSSSWYLGSWTFLTHLICLSWWWTCLVNVHCTSKLFFDFHQFLYNFLTNFIINNFLWRFFNYPNLDFLSQSTEKWTYLFPSRKILDVVRRESQYQIPKSDMKIRLWRRKAGDPRREKF